MQGSTHCITFCPDSNAVLLRNPSCNTEFLNVSGYELHVIGL
jgi:hypothetical protein